MKLKFKITKSMILLLSILVIGLFLAPIVKPSLENFTANNENENKNKKENFEAMNSSSNNKGINEDITGIYPTAVDKPILNSYPIQNNPQLKSVSDIWKEYPVFSLPSFEQITNNLRYVKNPDDGSCTPPMFCNTFYKDKPNKSNVVCQLPPVPDGPGSRVGYFRGNQIK